MDETFTAGGNHLYFSRSSAKSIAAANHGEDSQAALGGVDKFEPVSGRGEMDHAEEAVGKLVVSGCDGAVDFQPAERAFDAIALAV